MIEFWSWPPISLACDKSVMAGETELPQKSRTIVKAFYHGVLGKIRHCCQNIGEIVSIRPLGFDWLLLSGLDTLKRDYERLSMINLQFKAQCEPQKTFWKHIKKFSSPAVGRQRKLRIILDSFFSSAFKYPPVRHQVLNSLYTCILISFPLP